MSGMHEHHALPDGWRNMPYAFLLIERRKLMAAIIRKGLELLSRWLNDDHHDHHYGGHGDDDQNPFLSNSGESAP